MQGSALCMICYFLNVGHKKRAWEVLFQCWSDAEVWVLLTVMLHLAVKQNKSTLAVFTCLLEIKDLCCSPAAPLNEQWLNKRASDNPCSGLVLVLLYPALIAWNSSWAMRAEEDPCSCILKLPDQVFNRGCSDQANWEAHLASCLLSASPVTIWFSHPAECDNPNVRFQARGTNLFQYQNSFSAFSV